MFSWKESRGGKGAVVKGRILRGFFGDELPDAAERASSLGWGVIVSASGYVIPNHHVVEAADEIEVALADGKKLLAKVVGNDPETDIAVLRVNSENLPVITFGSSDALRVGDVVLAIGNPLDRKSTRLNSSHQIISYAVFCLKKKNKNRLLSAGPRRDSYNPVDRLSPPLT